LGTELNYEKNELHSLLDMPVRGVDAPTVILTLGADILEREKIIFQDKIHRDQSSFKTFFMGTTFYKTYDPVVLSGNIGYGFGFNRKIGSLNSTPGGVGIWNLVTTFAANENLSISGGIKGGIDRPSKIDGNKLGSTRNHVSLLGGVSLGFSERSVFTISITGGLTETAEDMSLGIAMGRAYK